MIDEIVYQIFPDRFWREDTKKSSIIKKNWGDKVDRCSYMGGDLKGIIKKLDYISSLGATAIYLNPIFKSPSNHKYDVENYYKIDEDFGSLNDFKNLIKDCHEKGIKIIIDGVFNHTSTEFFAFKNLIKNGEDSPYKDWYYIYKYPVKVEEPPSYRACGGVPWLPKLNTTNNQVQNYIINVIKYWENFGIDGMRLDVPFEIDKSMLKKIRQCTKLYIVGEIWGYGNGYLPTYFDGVTNYPLRDLVKKAVVNRCIDGEMFKNEWEIIQNTYGDNIYTCINLAGSHDTERVYTLCSENADKTNLFLALMFLLPGIPLIYYGDEIGMKGESDPYCRGCMIWDENQWNEKILNNIKYLISLRKNSIAIRRGKIKFTYCDDRIVVFERIYEKAIVKVYVNFGFQNYAIDGLILKPLNYKIKEEVKK